MAFSARLMRVSASAASQPFSSGGAVQTQMCVARMTITSMRREIMMAAPGLARRRRGW